MTSNRITKDMLELANRLKALDDKNNITTNIYSEVIALLAGLQNEVRDIHQPGYDTSLGKLIRDLDMGGHNIINLPDGSDVATQKFVKELAAQYMVAGGRGGGGGGSGSTYLYAPINATGHVVANDANADEVTAANALRNKGYNVRTCDATADEVQIQGSMDDLPTGTYPFGGGHTALSDGNFYINSPIQIPALTTTGVNNVNLSGRGYSTILRPTANFDDNIIESASSTARTARLILRDFWIYGDKSNQSSGYGLHLFSPTYSEINGVRISSCKNDGMYFEATASLQPADINIVNCQIYSCDGRGILADANSPDIRVANCEIHTNGIGCLGLAGGGNIVTGNRLYGSPYGLACAGTFNRIGFNYIQGDSTGYGIGLTNSENIVVGNHLYATTYRQASGVYCNAGCDNSVIVGNIMQRWQYGVTLASGAANNVVGLNNYYDVAGGVSDSGTSTVLLASRGWVIENHGTGSLLNGQTSVTITHGLSATPTYVGITWAENPTNLIADWWVDTVGATTFKVNGVDPGASNLDFYWIAKV